MNRIIEPFIKLLINAKKPRWGSNKLKVIIAINQYFSKDLWNRLLLNYSGNTEYDWDVVYCTNKIDLYRHIPQSDVCFIFGLGDFLLKQMDTKKLVYFPLLGLDFLKSKPLPQGLTIEQPPPYSAQSIAEYCIAMSIILTRNLYNAFKNHYSKRWNQINIIPNSIISITECKIGVLGLGKVGKVIAENFKKLGCEVIGCDRVTPINSNELTAFYTSENLHEFINHLDLLIVALPLDESTKHLIDKKALNSLGPNKFIINISRGEIIDEDALIQALKSNEIKGAVLDVFEREPLNRTSALYRCNNLILTPHIAGNINLFVSEIQQDFIHKALEYNKSV